VEKERKTKGKIREKISPPLDLVMISAPVVDTRQEACPFPFHFIYFRVAQAWVLGSFPQTKHPLANIR